MREIIFRGKTEKGEWVYGDLLHPDNCGNGYSIEDFTKYKNNCFDVIPETVGQYTGLTDKNGKKIFEGDIVKILYTDWISQPLEDTRSLEEYLDSLTEKGVVDFAPYVGWYLKNGKYDLSIISGTHGYIEVIGNIHDNPELIGGGENA